MAGQIAPGNLFDLLPDLKGRFCWPGSKSEMPSQFLAPLRMNSKSRSRTSQRDNLSGEALPEPGHIAGPKISQSQMDDIALGFRIAKQSAAWTLANVSW